MWTDAFQVLVLIAGLSAVLIKGSIDMGGFGNIWAIMEERNRTYVYFDTDPTIRHTLWTMTLGTCFQWLAVYGVNQAMVQRAMTTKTLHQAQIALYANIPGWIGIITLCGLCGWVVFAEYKDCDPLKQGRVQSPDQHDVIWVELTYCCDDERFCQTCLPHKTLGTKSNTGLKNAVIGLFGMIGGPVLGVFTLGIIYPWANSKGAIAGLLTSLGMTLWLGIGQQVHQPEYPRPTLSTAGCYMLNETSNFTTIMPYSMDYTENVWTTVAPQMKDNGPLASFYKVSYLWFGSFALIICTAVGLIVSFVTGPTNPKELDPRLISPLFDVFCCCLPVGVLNNLRCDVDADSATESD
ncbi:hypothetical protein CAPTEDRAFT_228761 [Capitella teleta]|uniref:Uncharacterized protein n=1 Tax=Capitella teleta TaxID=283909 RepID=R7U7Q0_CAPTE|nr:hypothetical protein CAPTEDRAFT_228761 [Capitella teleta]|eukprot:ELU01974.1 hypothetical protein CAPTEDRAFT_228761 [Capitella teleta]